MESYKKPASLYHHSVSVSVALGIIFIQTHQFSCNGGPGQIPRSPPNPLSQALFLLEGPNELKHSSEIHLYLWLLLGMTLIRLLVTPLLQAGVLYGLMPKEERKSGLPLFRGMKEFGRPVFLFLFIELVLISIPLIWILPHVQGILPDLLRSGTIQVTPILKVSAVLFAWMIYCWFIDQCLLFAQFGYLFKRGLWGSILIGVKYVLPGAGISLILGAFALILFIIFGSVSWIWTGLLALILQQSYPFIRSLFRVWGLTSQYQLWEIKSQKS
ncbi:hypothetical protein RE628_00135 [Paenibacillus sp. D2_2]|uniref:hypothetical protein n=1 Tax=Paenibacillus sp. D2_2 TaxID=3073092 RepID=UPI002814AA93|nr:hypothetical protein [Paenibacillus sp. D2_2]WMT41105.1 hypothetical protein RE628_00135 [Paenibacillus sp. D2_2]